MDATWVFTSTMRMCATLSTHWKHVSRLPSKPQYSRACSSGCPHCAKNCRNVQKLWMPGVDRRLCCMAICGISTFLLSPLPMGSTRSEEHTYELQSLRHLVCR